METNNLEKITQEIRSKLPELMEVKEGCLISDTWGIFKVHYICNQGYLYYMCNDDEGDFQAYQKIGDDSYTIIGSEPQLNDVLRWLELLRKKEQTIKVYDDLLKSELFGKLCSDWDLSKPYLKDQSQELIDSLAELIE